MCDDRVHRDECDCYDCVEARKGRLGGGCCPPAEQGYDVAAMWKDAFHQAYREVQVEIFKAKIKASMGKSMDKAAGLVLSAMLEDIQSGQKKSQKVNASREKFEKLLQETLKV